jgi:GxxExxY protein|tara:strand:- start:1958 stop:2377 length:420 start_codon:yes stop_codon:yes gene_type:complete
METQVINHEVHEEHEGYTFEPLSKRIISAAIEVHRELGPGLLESAYMACFAHELSLMDIEAELGVPLPVQYKGLAVPTSYRMDLVIDNEILVELKSVASLEPIHEAQVLTYLKLSGLKKALLINFNVPLLKDGIRRFVR